MQQITFKNDKLVPVCNFTWDDLYNTQSTTIKDLRFQLYYGFPKNPHPTAFMFDIDGVEKTDENIKSLRAVCDDSLNGHRYFIVYTGGGFHVYVPLNHPFDKADVKALKKGYEYLCSVLDTFFHGKVDRQVFGVCKYGRMPGSLNTKHNTKVEFVLGNNALPIASTIHEVIEKISSDSHVPKYAAPKENEDIALEDTLIFEHCGIIQHAYSNRETLGNDAWNKALMVFTRGNYRRAGHELSEGHPEYKKDEVDGYFDRYKEEDTFVACGTLDGVFGLGDDSPCLSCPHNVQGNSPVTITGRRPTPSVISGFHPVKMEKDIPTVNNHKCVPKDVANYFLNTHEDSLGNYGPSLYIYDGKKYWVPTSKKINRNPDNYYGKIIEKLYSIPAKRCVTAPQYKAIIEDLAPAYLNDPTDLSETLDNPRYMAFTDGVLDLATGKEVDPHPSQGLTGHLDYSLKNILNNKDKGGFSELFYSSLMDETLVKLLQLFGGLAISTIPTSDYSQMLWLYGVPGSGKSFFVKALSTVLQGLGKNTVIASKYESFQGGKGVNHDLRHTRVLVLDEVIFTNLKGDNLAAFEKSLNPVISGSPLPVHLLYTDAFTCVPQCTVIATSNEQPVITKNTDGFRRRLRPIGFGRVLKSKDIQKVISPFDKDKSLQEAFLAFCLDGLQAARDNLKNTGSYLPALTQEDKEELDSFTEETGGSIEEFVINKVELGKEYTQPFKELWTVYQG